MDWLSQTMRGLLQMALPIAVFSFALTWWAVSRGYLRGDKGVSGIGRQMKGLSRERNRIRKARRKIKKGKAPDQALEEVRKFDPVQEKWMKFGGGFYGVVAFYTYALIEWGEITDFIAQFGGILEMLRRISIGAVIEFLVNSILNFVAAIAWPFYWLTRAATNWFWIWFIVAYLGYWAGMKLALLAVQRDSLPWRRPDPGDDGGHA